MSLYLYALVAEPIEPLGTGLAGETLITVDCAPVGFAVCGQMSSEPSATAETLRAHDALVRELAERAHALLPARFGELAEDADDLRAAVAKQSTALAGALAAVRDREQMTLRIFGDAAPPPPARSGTEYLEQRRARPAVEARVRACLAPLVAAERVERGRPPLHCSLHHLVTRGSADAYRRALEALELGDARITISGPWVPYAFAPDFAVLPEEDPE